MTQLLRERHFHNAVRNSSKAVETTVSGCKSPRVVLAHGVFDVLHLGHLRYLEEARRQGDELVVSITSDRHASKAPGRPAFTAAQRAEMVGALACVDRVIVSDAVDAVEVIRQLRPAIYVKGPDYRGSDDSGLRREREAVEECGGSIHFTTGETFSSSSLINQHLDATDPALRDYLAQARAKGWATKIPALIERIAPLKVLFVGETIVDEYVYVSALGKPSKEFIVAGREEGREEFAGGVLAAARHAQSFVAETAVISHRAVRKTRFVDRDTNRKLFEVFRGDDAPLSGDDELRLLIELKERAADYDVVVVTDFGHEMMTEQARREVEKHARFLAVNTQTNSANHGFNLITKYKRADYVCIDRPEAMLASGDRHATADELAELIWCGIDDAEVIVTDGSRGCAISGQCSIVPAVATKIVDTMGAGDAFLAVTAPLVAAVNDAEAYESRAMVGFIGNIVGALKCGVLGHREPVSKAAVLRSVATLLK